MEFHEVLIQYLRFSSKYTIHDILSVNLINVEIQSRNTINGSDNHNHLKQTL